MTDAGDPDTSASGADQERQIHTDELVRRAPAEDSGGAQTADNATHAPLLANSDELLAQWTTGQSGFVDDPRQAVEQADSLVATVIQQLAQQFADERGALE